jgi:hypothetical protein
MDRFVSLGADRGSVYGLSVEAGAMIDHSGAIADHINVKENTPQAETASVGVNVATTDMAAGNFAAYSSRVRQGRRVRLGVPFAGHSAPARAVQFALRINFPWRLKAWSASGRAAVFFWPVRFYE